MQKDIKIVSDIKKVVRLADIQIRKYTENDIIYGWNNQFAILVNEFEIARFRDYPSAQIWVDRCVATKFAHYYATDEGRKIMETIFLQHEGEKMKPTFSKDPAAGALVENALQKNRLLDKDGNKI